MLHRSLISSVLYELCCSAQRDELAEPAGGARGAAGLVEAQVGAGGTGAAAVAAREGGALPRPRRPRAPPRHRRQPARALRPEPPVPRRGPLRSSPLLSSPSYLVRSRSFGNYSYA